MLKQMNLKHAGRMIALIVICLTTASCNLPQIASGNQTRSLTLFPAENIQVEIMAFTDSYTAIISQAIDKIVQQHPEHRLLLHDLKLRNVENAIIIAAGRNPIGALLDMTVMVSLQRQLAEEYWIPMHLGDAGSPLIKALNRLEEEIWLIADRALNDEEVEELRELIPRIRMYYKDQILVSSIRASEFAQDRTATALKIKGSGSLLTIFQIDPLAGLSPAAQELAQARLLAERSFFWAKRLPLIINWQMTDVILNTLQEPNSQQIIKASTELSVSSIRLAEVAEELSQRLPEERIAMFDQFGDMMAEEREAAIHQVFEGIADEREAIVQTFEREDVQMRGLLNDLRDTIDSTAAMSASLNTTIESTERLRASFSTSSSQGSRPFDITEYQTMAETLMMSAEEVNQLIVSMTDFADSPIWEDRNAQLVNATDHAQLTIEQLIDRSFRRGLLLIGTLIVGSLLAAFMYRLILIRILPPQNGL